MKVVALKEPWIAFGVPARELPKSKPALIALLHEKRGSPNGPGAAAAAAKPAKRATRAARTRRNGKAGSDEEEEEEAAVESNESDCFVSGEEADDGDLEPSQSSDLASGDTLGEAESAKLPSRDKANCNYNYNNDTELSDETLQNNLANTDDIKEV